MRRMLVACLAWLAAAVPCGLALASAGHGDREPRSPVSVQPSTGWAASWFQISFRAPDRTGTIRGQERYYAISATGPQRTGDCLDGAGRDAQASSGGVIVHVLLRPGQSGWCRGTFEGTVTEQERPSCPFREVCPMYVVVLRTIGRFTFHVDARPPGGDANAPEFTGLQSAVQCFGGPMRPGEKRPVRLSWEAASDDVTPGSRIVYDIFVADTSGHENLAQPNWTTRGNTSFTTPSLPPNRYFIVRARDRAGNEDRNTVEQQAGNPCL